MKLPLKWWENVDDTVKFIDFMRVKHPNIDHPKSKATIPFKHDAVVLRERYSMKNDPSVIRVPNYIWYDFFRIKGFRCSYGMDDVATLESLIDGTVYYMGIVELNRLWKNVKNKLLVGRFTFSKKGNVSKVVKYEV